MQLFSEIYGAYYAAVAQILAEAVRGEMTLARMVEIVRDRAFAESEAAIPLAMTGEWGLLDADLRPAVRREPTMPMTTLELRWMRTLLDDPRVRLFDVDAAPLRDLDPLFPRDAVIYFDRYADGDPYEDAGYVANFRTAMTALREHRLLRAEVRGSKGQRHSRVVAPTVMEWSPKDDKFRLRARTQRHSCTINVARLTGAELLERYDDAEWPMRDDERRSAVFMLKDERNALERVMLHFSDLEKETERAGEGEYRVSMRYEREDEAEIVIRLISFGPLLRVIDPESIVSEIKRRVARQKKL